MMRAVSLALLLAPFAVSAQEGLLVSDLKPIHGAVTAKALEHYRARRFREALDTLGSPADDTGRLLEARALFDLGRFPDAAGKLLDLAKRQPLLADLFRARAARALLNAGDVEAAAREAEAVQEETSAIAGAVLVAAEAHLAAGRAQEAKARAQQFVDRWPEKPSAAGALWVLSRASRLLGDRATAREATRRIYVEYPASPLAERAGEPALRPAEAITRAERLVKLHRNERASRELSALLARGRLSPPQRCRASYLLGAAQQRRRQHGAAFAALRAAARTCRDDDTAARALYLWGKGLLGGRRTARAARVLERLARRFPKHRLADDALLLGAQAWRRARELGKARAALERLVREMPQGDMATKARFELARILARQGDLAGAARGLAAVADGDAYADDPYLRGRPLYALGRLQARQGRKRDAVAAYRRCVREHPLTWWAVLARGRLRAAGEAVEEAAPASAATTPQSVPPALAASRAFQRGAALIRLGAGDLAHPEMRRAAREAGDGPEARAALAQLYGFARDWHHSHRIVRWKLKGALSRPPTSESWRLFHLAYPKGFWETIEPAARRFRVDPFLLIAIVREESAFNPSIESWANAIGLAQLIWPTALRMAQVLRMRRFYKEMLYDPAVNLTLGAKYLSNLLRRFRGSVPLAVAAYNAGELAVERWLRQRGERDLDDFVNSIPYEQTRLYTRRVLESYATYRYLYGEGRDRLLALGPSYPRQRRP